jgi:Tfp pilus assembly protein PilO
MIKKTTLFLAPTVVLFGLSYFLLFDDLERLLSKEIENNKKAKQEYQSIQRVDISEVKEIVAQNKSEIEYIKDGIKDIKRFNASIQKDMISANVDSKNWKDMLKYLKDYSKINNIKLSKIYNYKLSNTNIKAQTINMQVLGKGSYKDIVNFIKDIENFSTMVKIKDIQISKKNNIEFSINLEGWEFKVQG